MTTWLAHVMTFFAFAPTQLRPHLAKHTASKPPAAAIAAVAAPRRGGAFVALGRFGVGSSLRRVGTRRHAVREPRGLEMDVGVLEKRVAVAAFGRQLEDPGSRVVADQPRDLAALPLQKEKAAFASLRE